MTDKRLLLNLPNPIAPLNTPCKIIDLLKVGDTNKILFSFLTRVKKEEKNIIINEQILFKNI